LNRQTEKTDKESEKGDFLIFLNEKSLFLYFFSSMVKLLICLVKLFNIVYSFEFIYSFTRVR